MNARLITVTVNAYRGSDAIAAVRTQCKREHRITREYAAHLLAPDMQKADSDVAIVVTRDSFGPISANLRRTYEVSFWYDGKRS